MSTAPNVKTKSEVKTTVRVNATRTMFLGAICLSQSVVQERELESVQVQDTSRAALAVRGQSLDSYNVIQAGVLVEDFQLVVHLEVVVTVEEQLRTHNIHDRGHVLASLKRVLQVSGVEAVRVLLDLL